MCITNTNNQNVCYKNDKFCLSSGAFISPFLVIYSSYASIRTTPQGTVYGGEQG